MEIEQRKIYHSGSGSYLITLPKKWVDDVGLKEGDTLTMFINRRHIEMTHQLEMSKREVIIDARDLKANTLIKRIISYYLAGFDVIKVKIYDKDHRDAIEKASNILVGAEIMEDIGREVCVEVFLNKDRYNIENVLKRISNMCTAMFIDICSTLKKFNEYLCTSVITREREVDKLHFLALRQLILDERLIVRPREAFGCWSFIRRTERSADHITNIAFCMLKLRKELPSFCTLGERVQEMLVSSTDSFFNRDIKLAEQVLDDFNDICAIEEKLYRQIINQNASIEEALLMKSILDSLMRIAAYSTDIAEVSLNIAVTGLS